jgi:NAD(P)-dependent dehydrogenase (short-subunit alcohol dehydrogenase family)
VLPGTIDTPQNRAWMSEAMARVAIDPGAIADVIVFLLSRKARAITGAAIRVTGEQ